jgi:hypothetical protein
MRIVVHRPQAALPVRVVASCNLNEVVNNSHPSEDASALNPRRCWDEVWKLRWSRRPQAGGGVQPGSIRFDSEFSACVVVDVRLATDLVAHDELHLRRGRGDVEIERPVFRVRATRILVRAVRCAHGLPPIRRELNLNVLRERQVLHDDLTKHTR